MKWRIIDRELLINMDHMTSCEMEDKGSEYTEGYRYRIIWRDREGTEWEEKCHDLQHQEEKFRAIKEMFLDQD